MNAGDRDETRRLLDFYIDDVLTASDEEILAEAQLDYGDVSKAVQIMKAGLDKAESQLKK